MRRCSRDALQLVAHTKRHASVLPRVSEREAKVLYSLWRAMLDIIASKRNLAVLDNLRRCSHVHMRINKALHTGAPQPGDANAKDEDNSGAQQLAVPAL